jgi:hypothetical protein
MDPLVLQECEIKLDGWLGQGYEVFADDIDGELRITAHYVSSGTGRGSERQQEFWPMAPEVIALLEANGITVSRALAGPRPWVGPHPDDWEEQSR